MNFDRLLDLSQMIGHASEYHNLAIMAENIRYSLPSELLGAFSCESLL